jgi:cell division protease FtsH
LTGADKPSVATRAEQCVIALHEAGHALATRLLMPEGALRRVSILPTERGAVGYSLSIPNESAVVGKDRLEKQIRILLAGRAAEQLVAGEGELTAGASNDLQKAAELAGTMAMDLGMEAEPCVSLRALARTCQSTAQDAPGLCRAALNRNYDAVKELLSENVQSLMRLTDALIEREALTGEEVGEILNDPKIA